jgi:hypothetical protein
VEREQAAAKAAETQPAKQSEAPQPDPFVEQMFHVVAPYMR